jgi:hypothetical protein
LKNQKNILHLIEEIEQQEDAEIAHSKIKRKPKTLIKSTRKHKKNLKQKNKLKHIPQVLAILSLGFRVSHGDE